MKNEIIQIDENTIWPKNGNRTYNTLITQLSHWDYVSPYLKKTNVMIQAGGNCGLLVRPFVDKFKQIYTFEPDPLNFYCLNNNLPYSNVCKIQGCLGSVNKCVSLDNIFLNGDNSDVGAYFVKKENGYTPTFKIDDLNVNQCDLIMLDVEGFEYNVLQGAKNTLLKYKPVLCLEFYEPWLNRFNVNSDIIKEFLKEFGYKQVAHYHSDVIFCI